ncbi:MAG: hypothetical protein ABI134_11375 [Byssovorax sp.]
MTLTPCAGGCVERIDAAERRAEEAERELAEALAEIERLKRERP